MRRRFTVPMVLFIFLVCQSALDYALDPQKKITQYMHDVWRVEDGLPQNTVVTIIQSREGYLWLGTLEGVVRFDGVGFEVFDKRRVKQLSDNHIRALYQDRKGNLWIGTRSGGLTCLDAKNGKFTAYNKKQGLTSNRIQTLYEDRDGYLWIGTAGGGLNCLKHGKFISYTTRQGLSHDIVKSICEDREGRLWIGTDKGLNRLEDGKFTTYTTRQGLSHNMVWVVYEDPGGDLWIGTEEGLNRLKNGKFTRYTTREGLSSDRINAICEDRDGNLWIGTYGGGLNRLKNGRFTAYTTRQGLTNDIVRCIYEDREGSLWIGTWSGGLNRLKDGKFTVYTTRQGLSHDLVWSVYEDSRGSLWLGTDGGLNRLENGRFTVYTTRQGLSHDMVMAIYEDRGGSLWIGTNGGGLSRLEAHDKEAKFTNFTTGQGLSHEEVRSIYEDREGSLWIGTWGGGLNRLKDGKFTSYTTEQGLSSDYIYTLYEDREGSLWIGTEKGLNRLHRHKKDVTFTVYTTKEGLTGDLVRCIYEDREGSLWIGTVGEGLNRLKQGKFSGITSEDGLFNDTIHHILEDDGGNFWMSCNKGIFKASKNELDDFCEGKINIVHCVSYAEKDGMKSRECNGIGQPSGWKSRNGQLWFPTMKGVVMIDPQNIEINRLPPPVKIEEIIADKEKIQLSFSRFSSDEEKLVFSPGNERFEIHYTALSFQAPREVRFRCKLEGVDREWRNMGDRRTAYYTELSPGKYTFRVTAANNDGVWNEAGASISFYLEPYFYQAWWFYVMCAFGLLFLAFGIYRLRVKQITDRKIELERQVAERTRLLEESGKELEKLSIVARETHNSVTIMDAEGNLEWMNEGATRLYGYTLEQVIKEKGRNITQVSSNPDIRELLAKFIAEKEPLSYESLYTTRQGRKIWTQTTWTPVLDRQGNLTRIVSIGSDISQIKQSKEQIDRQNKEIRKQNQRILEQTERLKEAIKIAREGREIADAANQAKSEFLARMSHEIRTPMNSVIGFSEMLMETDLTEEQRDYAGTISRSGEALITIINDILDFSRIEAGKLSFDYIDFDPEVLAFDVCELTVPRLENRQVEILCRVGDGVPAYVKQDPGRFRQVLVNLMANAAKFTEKGEIQLSLDVEKEEKDRLQLHVMVADTGIGIPPDKQEGIFETFQQVDGSITRRFGGTGLGLAICKQIAKHMGGDIMVESTPGQGSTFHFHAWVERSKKTPVEKAARIDLAGKRILIVDDNPHNLDILEHILKKHGMGVVKQTSGEKVISILEENQEKGTPFDLCILDLMMPGLNGYEVARRIRSLDSPLSGLPLLAFSSSSFRQVDKYREYGFDAFLTKPARAQKLLKVVEQLLCPGKTGTEKVNRERTELVTRHSVIEHAKHSVCILLAEDNEVNRKLAVYMLTRAGYGLDIAENGKEAVDKYTSAPDKYDLIFMDVQMPEMDGKEATRKIREKEEQLKNEIQNSPHIPIIAMTAESMKGDREKCLEIGMDDYISKPIRREIVFEMIKKWVITEK